jgi:benzoyl-CoA reductase/2-hydroxyglutaryl-CoA dehydratase subunit BcrC/BadD/HgdB
VTAVDFHRTYDAMVDAPDEVLKDTCGAIHHQVALVAEVFEVAAGQPSPLKDDAVIELAKAVASLTATVAALDERIERRMQVHVTDDPHIYPDGSRS